MIITFFKRNVLALAPHYDWFKAGEAFLKQAYHLQCKVNQMGQVAPERISRRHAAQVFDLRGQVGDLSYNHPDLSVRGWSVGKKSTLRCNTKFPKKMSHGGVAAKSSGYCILSIR